MGNKKPYSKFSFGEVYRRIYGRKLSFTATRRYPLQAKLVSTSSCVEFSINLFRRSLFCYLYKIAEMHSISALRDSISNFANKKVKG